MTTVKRTIVVTEDYYLDESVEEYDPVVMGNLETARQLDTNQDFDLSCSACTTAVNVLCRVGCGAASRVLCLALAGAGVALGGACAVFVSAACGAIASVGCGVDPELICSLPQLNLC